MEQNDIEMAVQAAYQLLPLPLFEESPDAGNPSSAAVYERNEQLVQQLGEITPLGAANGGLSLIPLPVLQTLLRREQVPEELRKKEGLVPPWTVACLPEVA